MVSLWRGFLDLLADRSGLLLLLVASLSAVVAFAVQRKQDLQARDIKGWLTGGDSWAYYEPQWTKERKLAFFVRHFGDYPAYDVVLRILNEDTEKTPGDPIFVATAITRDRGFDWTEPRDLIFNRTPEPGESRRLSFARTGSGSLGGRPCSSNRLKTMATGTGPRRVRALPMSTLPAERRFSGARRMARRKKPWRGPVA